MLDQMPNTVLEGSTYDVANGGEAPDVSWFEALEGYSAAVDAARNFKARRASDWAFNPMWHSWYAHANKIDERETCG